MNAGFAALLEAGDRLPSPPPPPSPRRRRHPAQPSMTMEQFGQELRGQPQLDGQRQMAELMAEIQRNMEELRELQRQQDAEVRPRP